MAVIPQPPLPASSSASYSRLASLPDKSLNVIHPIKFEFSRDTSRLQLIPKETRYFWQTQGCALRFMPSPLEWKLLLLILLQEERFNKLIQVTQQLVRGRAKSDSWLRQGQEWLLTQHSMAFLCIRTKSNIGLLIQLQMESTGLISRYFLFFF